MRREAPQKLTDYGPLAFPAIMLTVFFVIPFGTMIAVSFFQRQQGGFYTPAFVLSNYERFASLFFANVLGFSLMLAVLVAICCVAIGVPCTYLLYPALVRLDPTLTEAARTLGASPLRAFFTVVVPALRTTILATLIMVFIFALGSYLLPQILGRPQHWTLSVLITDQAIYQSNMPFAAAMAVFLVLVTLAMVALTLFVGRKREATT